MDATFQRGTPITLVENFFAVDPLTQVAVPTDPLSVTFTVLAPDNEEQTYSWPSDAAVSNPSVGTFACVLPSPPLPPGEYRYRVDGVGGVTVSREDTFTVLESGVLPPDPSGVATLGPCAPWINGDDVARYDPSLGVGTATWELDDVAAVASGLMYEISGRQFPGVCQKTVRPCRRACSCWGGPAFGLGPFYWTSSAVSGYGYGWGWWNEDGEGGCGCGTESYIRLSGYPVREILAVKIDGNVLDPSEYRLDERRFLIRLADLTTSPPTGRVWPACQDLSLPDTQPGTCSVEYTYGIDAPPIGRWAAAQLAAELWKAFPGNQGECRLPSRVTRVARAGVTMERLLPTADLLRSGGTGLQFVDSFIAQVNPRKLRRRAAVFTPDVQRFGKRVGQ